MVLLARRTLRALIPWGTLDDADSSEGTSPSSSATDSAASVAPLEPLHCPAAEDARTQVPIADYDEVAVQDDLARCTQRGFRQAQLGATSRAIGRAFWMEDPIPPSLWPGALRKRAGSLSGSSSRSSSPPSPPAASKA